MTTTHPILYTDIENLATSDEFQRMAGRNKFKNLNHITEFTVSELMDKPGMNYRMLAELGEILKGYGLIDLMKEI